MSQLDQERRNIAEKVRQDLAIQNQLTPSQTRLFVRCVQISWRVPTISWSRHESNEQLDDARRLLHAADIYQAREGVDSPEAKDCYRRAGELLEWLSRAQDEVRSLAPIALYSAGAYQLGDLPAMARSLLQQADIVDDHARIYADFLRGDFDATLQSCAEFWANHRNLTGREGSALLLDDSSMNGTADDNDESDDRLFRYIIAELVRSIGLMADTLRRGDIKRFERARNKIVKLEQFSLRDASEDAWLLIALLRATADRFSAASIYLHVQKLEASATNPTTDLWHFAREQFARGRGTLWTSQVHGLNRLAQSSSFALCTPTGSGKTLIATFALLKELLLNPGEEIAPLGLYLVPSRALASEVEAKLSAELGSIGDIVITSLYGGSDWGITDNWFTTQRPTILIATVEKADALMRYLGSMLVPRLKVLIIDEAHQVVADKKDLQAQSSLLQHRSRAMRLEALVSRLLTLKPTIARIALTAVAGGAAPFVARWVEARKDAEPVGTRYRSTRQLIGVLQVTPNEPARIELDLMNGRPLAVRGREKLAYLPLYTPAMPMPAASVRNSIYHFNELHVLWTALHLKEGGRRILISVAQSIEVVLERYAKALALTVWSSAAAFVEPTNADRLALLQTTQRVCADYCGVESFELTLLNHGIATNHGQMPQRLRRLMTELVELQVCSITVATATLTEGVNLPFDIILLTSLKRAVFDPERQRQIETPLSTAEFQNLAGRAGRPGAAESMEGMTLIALPQQPSATAAKQEETQQKQIKRLKRDYTNLHKRMKEEGQPPDVASPLAVLLELIKDGAAKLPGMAGEGAFLEWLEKTIPQTEGDATSLPLDVQRSREDLIEALDELDSFLLAAIEEFHQLEPQVITSLELEKFLRDLWSQTFSKVATVHEEILSQVFVRRGVAIPQRIYPDANQRRKLYQFGFTPRIGRRFEAAAEEIIAALRKANDYGLVDPAVRFALFVRIGELVASGKGFGFRVRKTKADEAVLAHWQDVLAWWMQAPSAPHPEPGQLRHWQRFVVENLEFRMGVAIGSAVVLAWQEGTGQVQLVPSQMNWREITGLPWLGFWARELLRWGTLDPFVAFSLAQGIATTRNEAQMLRTSFDEWLRTEHSAVDAEDFISPKHFNAWLSEVHAPKGGRTGVSASEVVASLVSAPDMKPRAYPVTPFVTRDEVVWLDPAGYELAKSSLDATSVLTGKPYQCDFRLEIADSTRIVRSFTSKR